MTDNSLNSASAEKIIDALLLSARLEVSAEERAMFIADYPRFRAGADKLYSYGRDLQPATIFDPSSCYGGAR